MPTADNEPENLAAEVNRLYWESDRSVNQIAEDLRMSKGSLYELVTPRPAAMPCPECGEEMAYPNRTARDRGFLTCPSCGFEEEEEEVPGGWQETADRTGGGAVVVTPEAMREARDAPRRQALTRIVAGTALLGVAAGLVIATFLKKR